MLWLLPVLSISSKIEVEFDVKFTAACPTTQECQMIIDNGKQIVTPALRGKTYVRMHPGKHTITVTHPWCTFYDVDLTLDGDNDFIAVSNETRITKYPIAIKHMANVDKESLTSMINPKVMIIGAVVMIGMRLFKKWATNPANMERMQQYQANLQKQMEEAQKMQQQQKNK